MLTSTNNKSGPVKTALGMLGATALAILAFMSIIDTVWPAEIGGNMSTIRLDASDGGAEWQPWGVQVAGSFSESRALAAYRRLQELYPEILDERAPLILRKPNPSFGPQPMVHIRIPAPTREAADELCHRLRARRGSCLVLRN